MTIFVNETIGSELGPTDNQPISKISRRQATVEKGRLYIYILIQQNEMQQT